MMHKFSTMETVRQFLTAFSKADKSLLDSLLTSHAYLRLRRDIGENVYRMRANVGNALLTERLRWGTGNLDIRDWTVEGNTVTVKFTVPEPGKLFFSAQVYVLTLTVHQEKVGAVTLHCGEEQAFPLPAWPVNRPAVVAV
ncbi:MAG TPA: hypothetical protein EYP41_05150 [Anaerolineae bacterium]|nr:hypothetical protein [Anaerolineae bacterium]HIP70061.1 hypothetical protein [Anaerolineae bacterium]